MILNKLLIDHLLKEIKEKGRTLDYQLLRNLYDTHEREILKELLKYRNLDGGFGHGLEPDTTLPDSSVVCTDEAVMILEEIRDRKLIEPIIEGIVQYYEKIFIPEIQGWELVPPQVDDYPRAAWWNYSGVGDFSYGNPNPQIIGFLYENRRYLNNLDIDLLVEKVLDYINDVLPGESRKHNIISCIIFYNHLPQAMKVKIQPILKKAVDQELAETNWEEYCLQPYEIQALNPEFLSGHEELLEKNLEYQLDRLNKGLIMPNWHWGQYEQEFEKAKWQWAGYLTFILVKTLMS